MRIVDGTLRRRMTAQGGEISFLTRDMDAFDELVDLEKKTALIVDFKPQKRKRSLNANAYHYVLCEKIAKVLFSTQEDVHAQLMQDYGSPFLTEDGKIEYILMRSDSKSLPGFYIRPTGHFKDDGQYQWFAWIKPSHEYDTKEMSHLLDGTIYEAKELGIEVLSEDELRRMKAAWAGD